MPPAGFGGAGVNRRQITGGRLPRWQALWSLYLHSLGLIFRALVFCPAMRIAASVKRMNFQKTGYDSNSFLVDAALGVVDGADSVLWCYAFASIVFSGVMSVFLPLGLVIFLGGWALLSIFIALTSRAPVHMIAIDEQAVVIIGSISALMIASFGDEAASLRGLATILAIMSRVSFAVAISFFLASRYHLARLLELLPYPVICGFMAGIGWLLLDAAMMVALDTPISLELWHQLSADNNIVRLALGLAGGFFLLIFTHRIQHTWALPVSLGSE